MPQLMRMATISGLLCRFFKCPYQAKVMKMLEPISSNNMVGSDILFGKYT